MRLRWGFAAGLVLGLVLARCTPVVDPKALNGTALYVTVLFNPDFHVRQFVFVGQNASGNDVFTRDARPNPASMGDLNGPQVVRILLADSFAGEDVQLSVFALDSSQTVVEFGTSSVKVVLGREADVQVNLNPFVVADAGTDAGSAAGNDAGFDAGFFDASLPDGGTARCTCASGCCIPDAGQPDGSACVPSTTSTGQLPNGAPPLQLTFELCGKPQTFCGGGANPLLALCDPIRSNGCDAGQCSCGALPPIGLGGGCPEGTRCASVNGTFGCVCDAWSGCKGCCEANACRKTPGAANCGAAGQACVSCGITSGSSCNNALAGNGGCSLSPNCNTCVGVDTCCTGNSCIGTNFPTCRAKAGGTGAASVCEPCDLLRSDRCLASSGVCSCGSSGNTCGPGEYCRQNDAGAANCHALLAP